MEILTIDKKEFQKGITIDDEDDAGGMSPESYGLNYFLSKGLTLIPQPNAVSTSIDLTGDIIDSCVDPAYLGDDCFIVASDGKYYILDGTTLTLKQTDSAKTYTYGTSRIITFQGDIYCTSTNDITKLNYSMSTIDATWWSSTLGKTLLNVNYRHPMEIVEDTLYIADKNMIHTWDGTTGVYNAMSLPSFYNITELRISNDGRHLLVFTSETANYSHQKKTNAKLFIIDTVTLEFIREINIDDQVETAINVKGTTYVIYGNSFGYLSDNGLKLIRKISVAEPVYSSRVTANENSIIIAEDDKVLVFGDVNGKGNIFFYATRSEYPYTKIYNLLAIGNSGVDDNKIMISYVDIYSNNKVKILDFDSRGSTSIAIKTKKYFKGRVWIRRIDIETETLTLDKEVTISMVNSDGSYTSIGKYSYALNGAAQTARFDCNQLVDFIQLRLIWSNISIKKFKIYHESGE